MESGTYRILKDGPPAPPFFVDGHYDGNLHGFDPELAEHGSALDRKRPHRNNIVIPHHDNLLRIGGRPNAKRVNGKTRNFSFCDQVLPALKQ